MAEIAKVIFGIDLKIAVHKQEVVFDTVIVSYKSGMMLIQIQCVFLCILP